MQLDADGQHKPEFIAPMLEALEAGNDIVIGSRFLTEMCIRDRPWRCAALWPARRMPRPK